MRTPLRLALTMVALLLVTPASAEIYQWTDAGGRVHFTDTKPVEAPPGLTIRESVEVPVVQTRSAGQFRYRHKAATDGGRARKKHAVDQQRAQQCRRVQESLERVQAQLRAGYREPRGNRLRAKRRGLRDRYARSCR